MEIILFRFATTQAKVSGNRVCLPFTFYYSLIRTKISYQYSGSFSPTLESHPTSSDLDAENQAGDIGDNLQVINN